MKKVISAAVVVLMLFISVIPTFAAVSPQSTTYKYTVEVIPSTGGDGQYEFTTNIDKDGNQHVHLTPKPKPGYVFDHWVIDGKYVTNDELTKGDIDLIISGDIKVTPYYRKAGSSTVETGTVHKDNTGTSPKTGSNDFIPYAVIILSVAACGAVVVKLVKSKNN